MDFFTRLKRQATNYLTIVMLLTGGVLVSSWLILNYQFQASPTTILIVLVVELVTLAIIVPRLTTNYLLEPIKVLWHAILHVSTENSNSPAPNLEQIHLGRELVTSLCLQVYQLASASNNLVPKTAVNDALARSITDSLPLPLLVMDKNQTIIFANESAKKYLGSANNGLVGQNLYDCLNLSFQSDDTYDKWLEDVRQHSITSSRNWVRVHVNNPISDQPLQVDIAAYYNKENPTSMETIITLFDHTETYAKEDDSISYVAMAVHELRTPLTLLRGYIELFKDDLKGKMDPELDGYMVKMEAATKRLVAFINNILNISKVENDQLVLQLHEEDWNKLIKDAVDDFKIQASSRGKTIELQLDPKIPPVAADRTSLYEVLINLLDNAVKYSGESETITVKTAIVDEGMIQTTVEDMGIGIPSNVLPHLFEKFYRSHRTNNKIYGTGLGLYLSKVIVSAHGGNIWVRSFENEGTTVGFTIKPYSQLAAEPKNSDNKDITRTASGWIKNHSYYRK